MHDVQPRPVKTGSDPRQLPDFIALRDEMAKLTHPARPDVNWSQVEALSLSLFELNGVELQTGAWYTLARSHLARINGLNEGLAILNALLSHQWAQFWPQPIHARAEILNGLLQRLQKLFRTFSLDHGDLSALVQTEGLLRSINDILVRQELKHVCLTAPLMQQIQGALTRLENSSAQDSGLQAVTLPPQALVAESALENPSSTSRLVYVIRPEPELNVQVVHAATPQPKRWPMFLAGVCSALVLSSIALTGWHYISRVDEATDALAASVAPLPQALSSAQVQTLQQSDKDKLDPTGWLKNASLQLDSLAALPPDWIYQYGNGLLAQAKVLWPQKPEVAELQQKWQQRQAENKLSASALTGWHEGMQQLQVLADRLNTLDGQKGKYITVSELKSSVYQMMNSFSQTIPLEEQLRVMQGQQGDAALVTQQQIQRHLNGVTQLFAEQKSPPVTP